MRFQWFILFFTLFALSACSPIKSKSPLSAQIKNPIARTMQDATGKKYAIATQNEATTKAAEKMLQLGGNAIDAAVAASFTVAVERPHSTGLGGGGFMVIHFAKKAETIAVDFRERAPMLAKADMYLNKDGSLKKDASKWGILAGAVPGMVKGVLEIHEKYGKLDRQTVMQPAIELAEQGFEVYPHLAGGLEYMKDIVKKDPEARKLFLHQDGTPLKVGDTLKQPNLANTLKAISEKGSDGFYKGWVAQAFLATQKKHRGLVTQKDLDAYQVVYREPVRGKYKDYEIVSMPPPSSGGIHIIEILNILESLPLKTWDLFRLKPCTTQLQPCKWLTQTVQPTLEILILFPCQRLSSLRTPTR